LFEKTLIVPWNDLAALEKVLLRHGGDIAALIMEPVSHNIGCALPEIGYLEGVRELTKKYDVILIFDEIITGFRCCPGGAQEFFNIEPDLTTFGKAIANGFPLAVVGGKTEVMDSVAPSSVGGYISYGGTFNGHAISLAAAFATLTKLETGTIQSDFEKYTEYLEKGFSDVSERTGIPARFQGFGGQFQIYFQQDKVTDYQSASSTNKDQYAKFQQTMIQGGILWSNGPYFHHGITAAHSEEDIQKILDVGEHALKKLAGGK
jgi:glutamate-1-semialdehyde 2,1-aminomutase